MKDLKLSPFLVDNSKKATYLPFHYPQHSGQFGNALRNCGKRKKLCFFGEISFDIDFGGRHYLFDRKLCHFLYEQVKIPNFAFGCFSQINGANRSGFLRFAPFVISFGQVVPEGVNNRLGPVADVKLR